MGSRGHVAAAAVKHHPVHQTSLLHSTAQLSRQSILLDTLPIVHLSHVHRAVPPSASDVSTTSAPPRSSPTPPRVRSSVVSPLSRQSVRSVVLRALLTQLIDGGDVQTCCCVLVVVGGGAGGGRAKLRLPVDVTRRWYYGYIDVLHRLKLFSEAADMGRLCGDAQLGSRNTKSTSIALTCAHCRKASEPGEQGPYCTHCHAVMSACALCEMPVRGPYVWCQGCGHGGHAQHMVEWFAQYALCPTGCLHQCVEALVQLKVDG